MNKQMQCGGMNPAVDERRTITHETGTYYNNWHYWGWAGDPQYPLPEGLPCACGQMLWHIEKCKECRQKVVKPQAR